MSKIKIKHFGPIKEGFLENDGWLEIKKNTVFIGNQGSGKSTIAKLISTLSWLEKSLNRGDIEDEKKMTFNDLKKHTEYQKIRNYFKDNTYIDYIGEKFRFNFDFSKKIPQRYPRIEKVNNKYIVPKIMYIPAERNFLSIIKNIYNVSLPENVFSFAEELRKAQKELKGKKVNLPISSYKYEYDESSDTSYISGDDFKIDLTEAASGLQSFAPLYLVSKKLALSISDDEMDTRRNMSVNQTIRMASEITVLMLDNTISEKEKTREINLITSKYYNKCFINIVEEPEQNLFPTSQWEMLKSLLEFNNYNEGNKLIMTTHSPYIINYLSIAVQAGYLKDKIQQNDKLLNRLDKIVPLGSTIKSNEISIYQFDEINGTITKLDNYNGIPSDSNFLNTSLSESNVLFDSLLEIEQEL